jgi:hypothetical protein
MAKRPPPWELLICLDETEAALVMGGLYALHRTLGGDNPDIKALMRRLQLYLKHDAALPYVRKDRQPPYPV